MGRDESAWRCSQCGTINEPGSRACSNCGKWPSLFDLQASVDELPPVVDDDQAVFAPELFEPETFEPEPFEPATSESRPYETGMPLPEAHEPEAADAEGDEEPRSRFPRWAITAIWVIGLVVWLVANALTDRG